MLSLKQTFVSIPEKNLFVSLNLFSVNDFTEIGVWLVSDFEQVFWF